jgi:hypothetical protein
MQRNARGFSKKASKALRTVPVPARLSDTLLQAAAERAQMAGVTRSSAALKGRNSSQWFDRSDAGARTDLRSRPSTRTVRLPCYALTNKSDPGLARASVDHQHTGVLTRIGGATRHRPLPLIGRVTRHGFQPTDETIALQNLNVMTVDQRFNLPDNIRVLFANEDQGVAGHMPLRVELINPIDGHDGGAPQRYTNLA